MSGKTIRETLGVLGVIASLIFVGVEIRQNTIASRAAAYQAIGIATATAFDNTAHNRRLIINAHATTAAEMDEIDWLQWANLMSGYARLGETLLLQVEEGILPADAMERLGYVGWRSIFQNPKMACVWPLVRPGVSPSFREFVETGQDPSSIDCTRYSVPANLF